MAVPYHSGRNDNKMFITAQRRYFVLLMAISSMGLSSSVLALGPTGFRIATATQDDQPESAAEKPAEAQQKRQAHLVRVSLPISSKTATAVQQTLQRLLDKAPAIIQPNQPRPAVVLEFDTSNGRSGKGSDLGACLSLARYLQSTDLNRLEIIAYIPGPRGFVESDGAENGNSKSLLQGHAVLVAIACSQIAMHPKAEIGNAGIDEENIEELVSTVYKSIAAKRLTLPVAMVMKMLDSDRTLMQATIANEPDQFVDEAELKELGSKVTETNSISPANEMAKFSGQELAEFRKVRMLATSKNDLARQLDVPRTALEGDPTLGKEWSPVQVTLPSYVDSQSVQWAIRALDSQTPTMIIVEIDSSDGDPDACMRLAESLADYDSNEVRTVAYVKGVARGPVALIALVCDHLIMTPNAEIGGKSETELDRETIDQFAPKIKELAKRKGRDWSLMMATFDPALEINRYINIDSDQKRLLSEAEHQSLGDESKTWKFLSPLGFNEGIAAESAWESLIATAILDDMESVSNYYQLTDIPKNLEPTMADKWLEKIARTLASPFVAPWLLFGAVFFISTEMSAPGIGVPGFLGTLCLILFFWSQHLDGNAHWLEILLFITGAVFIMIELFALPGFGIFGIGGLIMVVAAIVLASQTFIIPRTTQDLARLPASLMPVVAAGVGFIAAIFTLRKVLPNAPYFRRMMLQPIMRDPTAKGIEKDPEAMVDWGHLVGRSGQTVTRLAPSGKARISGSVYDVITDGRMLDKGTKIEVAEVTGNRILVRVVDTSNAST